MDWMKKLEREENNEEFSLLVHRYFKMCLMRIMQKMREKYEVPQSDIPTLVCAIMARLLNESCYAVGSQITENFTINEILSERQRVNLIKVLSGQDLNPLERDDIDFSCKNELNEFKKFIIKNNKAFDDDTFC